MRLIARPLIVQSIDEREFAVRDVAVREPFAHAHAKRRAAAADQVIVAVGPMPVRDHLLLNSRTNPRIIVNFSTGDTARTGAMPGR